MKVNVVYNKTGELISLEISEETTVEVLRSLIEIEFNLDDSREYGLSVDGNTLSDKDIVLSKVASTDSVLIVCEELNQKAVNRSNPSVSSPEDLVRTCSLQLLSKINKDQSLKSMYCSKSGEYKEAIEKNDANMFTELIKRDYFHNYSSLTSSSSSANDLYNLDPLSPEYQKIIEEQVRKQNVEENLLLAQDHFPESFAQVHMLFINAEVNGHSVKAFIDSGAQTTIMSKKCAERCNLLRLIDYRFKGVAHGVGTSNIVGKIHVAQMKIGNSFFQFSITVLEEDRIDFLFGLDLLRMYQCCIDLRQNAFTIGNEKVQFLSESEINGEIKYEKPIDAENDQSIDEGKKLQLISLGFSESQVINALRATNGNTELAASLLFSNENI